MKRGFFITIEGLEGSGKSSILKYLENYYHQAGYSVLVLREPGSTRIGEEIRQILLNKENKELSKYTELLLYLAARTQLIEEKLAKALKEFDIILCDRFFDSTLVYQGYALGLGKIVDQAVKLFSLGIAPDKTILLDSKPKAGLNRIKNKDRIESRSISYHNKLREGFLKLAKRYPKRICVVDASGSLDDIYPRVAKVIKDF